MIWGCSVVLGSKTGLGALRSCAGMEDAEFQALLERIEDLEDF